MTGLHEVPEAVVELRAELADVPRHIELPTCTTPTPGELAFTVPGDTAHAVAELAASYSCRPSDILLTAWLAVLHRYGSQDAVLVGVATPTGWAPVTSRVGTRTSFGDLIDQARRRLDLLADADLPKSLLNDLVPTFQVGFTTRPAAAGADILLVVDRDVAAAPLRLITSTVDARIRERLARHLLTLLGNGCVRPSVPLSHLRMLTERDIKELRTLGTGPEGTPPTRTVAESVAEHARIAPNSPAVVSGDRRITYAELDRKATQLAHRLKVEPQQVVGLLLDRSPEWVITVLAAFRLGALPLPLDPRLPGARVAEALKVSPPAVTVCKEGTSVPDGVGRVLVLDDGVDQAPTTPVQADVTLADLAYVVQTSGSTGVPKAIGGLHSGLAHSGVQANIVDHTTAADRVAWLIPPSAAIGFYVVAAALTAGASLHIADADTVSAPTTLQEWLLRERITQMLAVTPVGEALQALEWPKNTPLRTMTVAGEKLRHWGSADLPFDVGVLYGCAEAFMITDSFEPWSNRVTSATATETDREQAPPVGRPIPGVRIRLVDANLNLVPVGAIGEVLVSSPQLSAGYLSDAAATADKFLPDPLGPPGSRVYRTGDLARYRPDGVLEYCGRADTMVKIRGYRIEVAEVERALLAHPAVTEVAVVPAVSRAGRTELAACVVLAFEASAGELREWLTERLPEYMVPGAYPVLDRLPRNAADKIDRTVLPPDGWDQVRSTREYHPPRDETEARVVALWQELLGLDRVSVDDNFLELGGDSLLASRVRARIREQLGVEISLREMAVRATPAQIAQLLRERPHGRTARAFPPVKPTSDKGARP